MVGTMPWKQNININNEGFLGFFTHFRPGTMTTHAESINSAWTGQTSTTHNIEHRTEPVSH